MDGSPSPRLWAKPAMIPEDLMTREGPVLAQPLGWIPTVGSLLFRLTGPASRVQGSKWWVGQAVLSTTEEGGTDTCWWVGAMRFEELLEQVGGFGPFQLCNVALLALPRVLLPMHFLLPVFLAAVPAHRCALPGAPANFSHQDAWLEAHLPREPDGTLSSCLYFTHSQALPNTTFWGADQSPGQLEGEPSTAPCPQGWDYDRSEFSSTIATEVPVCETGGHESGMGLPLPWVITAWAGDTLPYFLESQFTYL